MDDTTGLTKDELFEYEHGLAVKHFIESDTYTQYVFPRMMAILHTEFPDPKNEGWEEAYRKAFALTQATTVLNSLLKSLASRGEDLRKKAAGEQADMDIQEA